MQRTYALTRTPDHRELRRAFDRMSRTTRDVIGKSVPKGRDFNLASALHNDDPETLTSSERRAVAQMLHDRGAAFMLSPPLEDENG